MTDRSVTDTTSGVVYHPWRGDHADLAVVGFRCVHPNGRTEYLYLVPSDGSDDGVPTVFAYQGTTGDPNQDAAVVHFVIDTVGQ